MGDLATGYPMSTSKILNYLLLFCCIAFCIHLASVADLSNLQPHSNQVHKPTPGSSSLSYGETWNELEYLREEFILSKKALEEAKLLKESVKLRKNNIKGDDGVKGAAAAEGHAVSQHDQQNVKQSGISIEQPKPPESPVDTNLIMTSDVKSHLSYLRSSLPDPDAPRKKVTILLYNKFEGFVDWWRDNDEFIRAAKKECSTECIFTQVSGAHVQVKQWNCE